MKVLGKGERSKVTLNAKDLGINFARDKEQRAGDIIFEELLWSTLTLRRVVPAKTNKSTAKSTTTAHFVKFMNELLDIMDMDKSPAGNYLVMDN